jgi:hypothetical protein
MGKAKFTMSAELFIDLLHMPAGTKIVSVKSKGWRDSGADVEVCVEHHDIPYGGGAVETTPILRRIEWDWNLPRPE